MRAALTATLSALGLLGLLAACNTVEGFGRDVQQGGAAITDQAQETEQQM